MTFFPNFWAKVKKTETCWIWTGAQSLGYGQTSIKHKVIWAHRFSYELHKGPIPDGLQIDHLCKNKLCVNPDHLEAVSQKENLRRGDGIAARNSKKTHCPQGHEFTPENTYHRKDKDGKFCRKCVTEQTMSRYYAKNLLEAEFC